MAPQYPLVKTFLVAAWLEAILYGIFFCGFWFSVYISFTVTRNGRSMATHNRVIFGTSVIMFIVATLHLAMNGYRVITGYVETTPGGPVDFLGVISSWHHIFKDVMYTVQSLLGDAMAVYRCWILWNRDYRFVILPFCLLLTSTIAGCMVTVLFANIDPNASIFDPRLTNWITVFYSIAVAQNIITTGLMAFRLWQREKRSAQYRISRGAFIPILLILMESAALYLFVETLLLTLYAVNYNAQFILLEAVIPVIGITFCMITGSRRDPARIGSVELHRIAVNITKEVEADGNSEKMTPV
ncbi:hypothetical protein B0H14DRAFT_3771673 [Mycena olivaceomarginata]|nr:hypothetical protein B0H14DRAFT_3771673 [Mycena olivaceomarginata]